MADDDDEAAAASPAAEQRSEDGFRCRNILVSGTDSSGRVEIRQNCREIAMGKKVDPAAHVSGGEEFGVWSIAVMENGMWLMRKFICFLCARDP